MRRFLALTLAGVMAGCPEIPDPNADSDGDGISDLAEEAAGTDPKDDDSDDDGLSDGEEAGTDPNRPDSDADGMSDAQEVQTVRIR